MAIAIKLFPCAWATDGGVPILGGGGGELGDRDYLAARGVRICLQGHQPIMAGYQAVHDTMKALREGTKPADLKGLPSGDFKNMVIRNADNEHWIDDYLGGKQE